MGLTYVWARVANPARPEKSIRQKFLVDSGAAYSVVPAKVLQSLGIKPRTTKTFLLADGTDISRKMAGAMFFFQKEEGLSPVIFGETGDAALLGVVSLESMGLVLDPLQRQLRPMPMLLQHHSSRRASIG